MAKKIATPQLPPHHPEYQAMLQAELRPRIARVIAEAEAAGWLPQAIDYAVMVLAASNMKMRVVPEAQEPSAEDDAADQ